MKFILKKLGQVITEKTLEQGQEYLIGRDSKCDFVLDSEMGISRKHFKIYTSKEQAWIIESISTHGAGVFLDGEEADGVEIGASTTLSFKNYFFEFLMEDAKEPTATSIENTNFDQELSQTRGLTRVISRKNLSTSLCISVEGESPEYVSLNQGDVWVLGRSEDCEICIEHPNVSAKHLKIVRNADGFSVNDMGSSNGSKINGSLLKKNQIHKLRSEDVIEISDLKILFEVQNEKFKDLIDQLPSSSEEETQDAQMLGGGMVAPKVIVEDAPEDEEELASTQKKFLNPRRIIVFSIFLLVLGGIFYSLWQDSRDKPVKKTAEELAKEEEIQLIDSQYKSAERLMTQKNYDGCIDFLKKIHTKRKSYRNSLKLLAECQRALDSEVLLQKKAQEEIERKEREKEIKAIVEKCKKQAEKFQTVEDVNACLDEAIKINPAHPDINALQLDIGDKERERQRKEVERQEYLKSLAYKKAFFNRAKAKDTQAKKLKNQDLLLLAAKAYDKFVKVAGKQKSLKKLKNQAQARAEEIRSTYKNTLDKLYGDCESLISEDKMREAYPVCEKILEFKERDERARAWMKQARETLQKRLKPKYEDSTWKESLGKTEAAKTIWREILEKDIKSGYYYQKARAQLKKYQ